MDLRELRKQLKKTAKEVAEKLGVVTRTVHSYEQGIRRVGLEEILTLSKLYDCTAEEIILAQLKSIEIYNSK